MDKIRSDEKHIQPTQDSAADEVTGKVIALDNHEVEQFYSSFITQAYRLKSELGRQTLPDLHGNCLWWQCLDSSSTM